MSWWVWAIRGAGLAAVVHALGGVWGHVVAPRDREGDAKKGIVIFVESIRWLGVAWGRRTVAAGLRDAGFSGRFHYWKWHAAWRGWLVLPAIMDRGMLERQGQRLADVIAAKRRDAPRVPIYVMGYSCGAYVAVRAVELLDEDVCIDGVALLAGAISPGYDLSAAATRVDGPLVNSSSVLDWLILGLGTLVFGTADRKHRLAAGMIGLRKRPPGANVIQLSWTPGRLRDLHWGGHFAASSRRLIARRIAAAMGIGPREAVRG